jgi:ATP-binding protein involved in chromosome partitioning
MQNIKNILLISSGKGGVGKSTVAANIACALHLNGLRVGVLDADIYGPSQFQMFGIETYEKNTSNMMVPTLSNGLQIMSSASFKHDNDAPMAWRGPMASLVLNSMIFNTQWDELDFLVVDMPPGTGDIQIEIIKKLPKAKVIIVTTPQEVALIDCKKGIEMFINNKIEILGVVENMNHYVCSHCGKLESIFGDSKVKDSMKKYNIPVLAEIPIVKDIAKYSDDGLPIVLADKEHLVSKTYLTVVENILNKINNEVSQ